ncbi:helix-turn-helix domain-containing protein [Shimazuella sp. AN120528]|uniref:helix-turn-helix domain-containing protein n=1 Tax=Shimazuella soli TaxID=1892854 RepID=UPI001F0D557C|nr:helix-turn-helix domain-containing protein [Shimazuella soli]MCH5586431.1 helix-turn-helix domain-containing protein [Shimazuella soli]
MKELGYHLRSTREQLGISIEELSEATRIEIKYLEAIERGDFEALPGPVYIRSYLRTYSIYINLDPRKVIKIYQESKQVAAEHLSRTARIQREQVLQRSDETSVLSRSKKQEFGRSSEKMVTMSRAVKNQSQTNKSKKKAKKKKDSGFAKFYNGLLITGFLLLLVAAGIVVYLRSTSTEVAEISDKVKPLTASESNGMLG